MPNLKLKQQEAFQKIYDDLQNGIENDSPINIQRIAVEVIEGKTKLTNDINETFMFACDMCGDCCRSSNDIMLSIHDVYRISKELNELPEKWIPNSCITYLGSSSQIPLNIIESKIGMDGRPACAFLEEKKYKDITSYSTNSTMDPETPIYVCGIQNAKPNSCAMFPIGRIFSKNEETEEMEIDYIVQIVDCQERLEDQQKPVTIKQFLGGFESLNDISNQTQLSKWNDFLAGFPSKDIRETFIAMSSEQAAVYSALFQIEINKVLYYDMFNEHPLLSCSEREAMDIINAQLEKTIEIAKLFITDGEKYNHFQKLSKMVNKSLRILSSSPNAEDREFDAFLLLNASFSPERSISECLKSFEEAMPSILSEDEQNELKLYMDTAS